MNNKIRKVLIANRGEIALRIERAATQLGIEAVVALSEADAAGYVGRTAKNVVILGPAPVQQSYTNIGRIIDVALEAGCDAVHPGYGFLSERADFAAAVVARGLTWIGPTAASISSLGSKTAARAVAISNGVPVATGTSGELTDEQLVAEANRFGFPVLIKAVAGGGGRGMRRAFSDSELREQLPRARGEAKKNFGSDDVFLEQLIIEPRHVEVQVFGDSTGNVVSFGTRDCSSQRKHQKVIEEGPAPFLSAELSAKIEAAAVKVAKAVGYQNAGTSEFLVSGERFFFLEMNTRIQVEHPVTEEVTGTDLVALQFRIAAGEKLSEIAPSRAKHGHAIELRLYAEDPAQNYAPSLGVITHLDLLDGAADAQSWLRIERGFEAGDEITPYYDAMIAKIIVTGDSRAEAIHHAQRAIRQISVGGIRTNQAFLAWLLHESPFRDAPIDITFIDRMWDERSVELANDILLRDPCHGSLTRSENVQHEERCFVAGHPVSLVHEMDATFLATALTKPDLSIRSNGRTAALQALEERLRG